MQWDFRRKKSDFFFFFFFFFLHQSDMRWQCKQKKNKICIRHSLIMLSIMRFLHILVTSFKQWRSCTDTIIAEAGEVCPCIYFPQYVSCDRISISWKFLLSSFSSFFSVLSLSVIIRLLVNLTSILGMVKTKKKKNEKISYCFVSSSFFLLLIFTRKVRSYFLQMIPVSDDTTVLALADTLIFFNLYHSGLIQQTTKWWYFPIFFPRK